MFGIRPQAILAVLLGFLIIMVVFAFKPFTVVDAGFVGVKVTMGSVDYMAIPEGFHLISPMAKVVEINTRAQKVVIESGASSKDLQQVAMEATIGYHVSADKAPLFYQKLGTDFQAVVVNPAVAEVLKAVVARYSAEELITKREEVSAAMRSLLIKQITARAYSSIVVDEVNLTNFSFSKSFSDAVEAKQEASQRAEKAKNDLVRIGVEGQQKIVTAKAEAEALNAQRAAITPELLQLKALENQHLAIQTWDGKLPSTTGGAMPFINVGK